MHFKTLVCGVVLTATLAGQAGAKPLVTINVPVDFTSINEQVQAVRVTCFITANDPITGKPTPFTYNYMSTDITPDAAGNYKGVVPIVWDENAFYGRPSELVMIASPSLKGSCQFGLMKGNAQYTPGFAGGNAVISVKPGTKFIPTSLAN